jgi:hypothetical protein
MILILSAGSAAIGTGSVTLFEASAASFAKIHRLPPFTEKYIIIVAFTPGKVKNSPEKGRD